MKSNTTDGYPLQELIDSHTMVYWVGVSNINDNYANSNIHTLSARISSGNIEYFNSGKYLVFKYKSNINEYINNTFYRDDMIEALQE